MHYDAFTFKSYSIIDAKGKNHGGYEYIIANMIAQAGICQIVDPPGPWQ